MRNTMEIAIDLSVQGGQHIPILDGTNVTTDSGAANVTTVTNIGLKPVTTGSNTSGYAELLTTNSGLLFLTTDSGVNNLTTNF